MEVENTTIIKTKIVLETITEPTKKFSITELKNIKNIINKLENYQLIEIIKIIYKYNFNYKKNNNVIFIDMTKLDNTILDEIYKYLNFINKINKFDLKLL